MRDQIAHLTDTANQRASLYQRQQSVPLDPKYMSLDSQPPDADDDLVLPSVDNDDLLAELKAAEVNSKSTLQQLMDE